jgi:hypothetical protein
MSQRFLSKKDSLDDFPTPPWASRALCEYIIRPENCVGRTCLEPAAGRGYMSEPLAEFFTGGVTSTDIADYGYPLETTENFVGKKRVFPAESFDWVITNPPFNLLTEFVERGLYTARTGTAMLMRTVVLEGQRRYKKLFQDNPPWVVAPFVERVPIHHGRVDPKGSSATSYSWFVWWKDAATRPAIALPWAYNVWIPPCRRDLEQPQDYTADPKDWRGAQSAL